jgi:hypothetical protein
VNQAKNDYGIYGGQLYQNLLTITIQLVAHQQGVLSRLLIARWPAARTIRNVGWMGHPSYGEMFCECLLKGTTEFLILLRIYLLCRASNWPNCHSSQM